MRIRCRRRILLDDNKSFQIFTYHFSTDETSLSYLFRPNTYSLRSFSIMEVKLFRYTVKYFPHNQTRGLETFLYINFNVYIFTLQYRRSIKL